MWLNLGSEGSDGQGARGVHSSQGVPKHFQEGHSPATLAAWNTKGGRQAGEQEHHFSELIIQHSHTENPLEPCKGLNTRQQGEEKTNNTF